MRWLFACLALIAAPLAAHEAGPDARAIVERGVAAHGGELFLEPGTLVLTGSAVFYSPNSNEPRSRADDYRMWREMDPDRTVAHGADGKVRIIAKSGETTLFEVGYDGETTWTQDGIMPKEQADAYWASNFGFGIIRSALDEGFTLERAPSRDIGGHEIDLVRIVDPQGQETLFGFDHLAGVIRYMAFDSPRGWHERHYDDFITLENGWVQARLVTLFYDGIKNNTVYWSQVTVGEPIPEAIFTPPAAGEE